MPNATYTRQAAITNGDVIDASLFNAEYDQLVAVFEQTNGHSHDGTGGQGAYVPLISDADNTDKVEIVAGGAKTTGTHQVTGDLTVDSNIVLSNPGATVDGRDLTVDGAKLDAIEASATADQTGAEIKALYEGEANAFTDAQYTKLAGIEAGATADQTGAEIKAAYEAEADTNAFTDADVTKLGGIEAGATADQTKADIDALNINADQVDGIEAAQLAKQDSTTGAVQLSVGTTAQRTGGQGGVRYNTTEGSFEGHNGTEWGALGGGGLTWITKAVNFTATAGEGYLMDSANVTVVTMPSGPADGDVVAFSDLNDSWATVNITVNGNGKDIEGSTPLTLDVAGSSVVLVFSSTTDQWEIVQVSTGVTGPRSIAHETQAAGSADYDLGYTPASPDSIIVAVGNVLQSPNAFTLTGANIDFGEVITGKLDVWHLGVPLAIGTPGAGTVGTSELANAAVTEAKIEDGKDRLCSLWGVFNGSTNVVGSGYNISSITDNGTGKHLVNFTVAMDNTDYAVVVTVDDNSSISSQLTANIDQGLKTTGYVGVTGAWGNATTNRSLFDFTDFNIVIFGGKD